ncbi:nuclear cap-binding protein subunit 1 [Drosophila obscura]|uniref:nuclear cap-binding protein subunit 1 n=1 Tax=Drosophila obscura TaxID=7282 RepID=UPI001BB10F50|nr:nuclear cap-binding protein subunit 1 [Drosophila obscura]XP_022212155.2 nuclear cap-binding protein subunit 1 [Drosophila obscura]XP_022212159.2 nuclear cap-binding protein subunit 1 [Drosophila obscura]
MGDRFRKRQRRESVDSVPCKRRRQSHVTEDRIESINMLMAKLGRFNIVGVLLRIPQLELLISKCLPDHKEQVLSILKSCVNRPPSHATGSYATIVGLLNIGFYPIIAEFLGALLQSLRKALVHGKWENARGLLHFFTELYNCNVINGSSILRLYLTFALHCVSDEMDGIVPQLRSDFFAYSVITALPLIGRDLQLRGQSFDHLITTLHIYMRKRTHSHGALLSIFEGTDHQEDYLDTYWRQIVQLRQNNWLKHGRMRPSMHYETRLSTSLQHDLPDMEMPEINLVLAYPRPWVVFRIFDFDQLDIELSTGTERYFLECEILELFEQTYLDRKVCADSLVNFMERNSNSDFVAHCIVEVILGQMLALPKSPLITLSYGSILVEMCKRRPDLMHKVIAEATLVIITKMSSLRVACFNRLINWLSHYMSNFRFAAGWRHWESFFLESSIDCELNPRAIFMRELLKKCVRLNFYEGIRQIVPVSLHKYMPPVPEAHFPYSDGAMPGAQLAHEINKEMQLRRKKPEIIEGIMARSDLDKQLKIHVLTTCVLRMGCASFTHTFAALQSIKTTLSALASSETDSHAIMAGLFDVWVANEQFQYVVAEKLLRMNIVNAMYIVSWIFTPRLKKDLTKMYLWELLYAVLRHIKNPERGMIIVDDEIEQSKALKNLMVDAVQRIIKVLNVSFEENKTSVHNLDNDYWFQMDAGQTGRLSVCSFRGLRHNQESANQDVRASRYVCARGQDYSTFSHPLLEIKTRA